MAKILISDMYCTKCGNRCMSIPRKKGGERESGHLKKIFCIYCGMQWNAAECDQNGYYTYRDFMTEFENEFYLVPCKEAKVEMRLRFKPTKNGQDHKAYFAKDYKFEEVIKQY